MSEDLLGSYELLQVMPRIGLSAFVVDSAPLAVQRLVDFFDHGGRLLEVAELFSNFQHVWTALSQAHLQREDIFIIVRIWPQQQSPGELLQRIERFLEVSKFQCIDILLAHAPIDINNRFEQWSALESAKKRSLARTLGLANMSLNQLMTVVKDADILPAFFITEISPFKQQRDLVEYCTAGSIVLINSEPCCKGIRNRIPKVIDMCQQLQIAPDQLLFRWSLMKGFVTLIPPTSKGVGLNPTFLDQPLSEEVMEVLDSWEEGLATAWAPVVDEDS